MRSPSDLGHAGTRFLFLGRADECISLTETLGPHLGIDVSSMAPMKDFLVCFPQSFKSISFLRLVYPTTGG